MNFSVRQIYGSMYHWFMKQPRWLQIVIPLGAAILFYFVLKVWGILLVGLIAFFAWFYGRKGADKKFTVAYITGLPQYSRPVGKMNLVIGEDGITFKALFSPEAKLLYKDITKIEAETKTQITRTASMFKGAAGLVLAGPVGAMVGMGIGSKHDDSQYFVSVIYKDELGEDNMLVLQQKGFMSNQIGNAFEIATMMKEARKQYFLKNK